MNEIKAIEAAQMKSELDEFKVGDTVRSILRLWKAKPNGSRPMKVW